MNIKFGDKGPLVKKLQEYIGVDDDSEFGPQTQAMLRAYQSGHALPVTGVVDDTTWYYITGELPTVATKPAPSGHILGIDVYHGDQVNSWAQIASAGNVFAMIKASDNLSADSAYAHNYAGAVGAGLIPGAYHFMHFNTDPVAQAKSYAHILSGLKDTDIQPCCDWEYANGNPGHGDDVKVKTFLDTLEALTGRIPMIYGNAYIFDFYGNPSWLKRHKLWLPNYSNSNPSVPAPFDDITFMQYTESARIPGLGNPGDESYFKGTVDDLRAMIQASKI